ncbi:LuxR C-terminal-related transcriptional regulator [Streptomyces sp. NPDC059853]|uniref:LuxR C-terminal-related transcriptional regulator n=1 Tax=Streptomyces sp. NPDC059853 TaxID=3346973 RepID=UPI00365561F3
MSGPARQVRRPMSALRMAQIRELSRRHPLTGLAIRELLAEIARLRAEARRCEASAALWRRLTPVQRQVLLWHAQGVRLADMAERLDLSVSTITVYRGRIAAALGVSTITQAVGIAAAAGVISVEQIASGAGAEGES